jgi:hypothetical protein
MVWIRTLDLFHVTNQSRTNILNRNLGASLFTPNGEFGCICMGASIGRRHLSYTFKASA